MIPAAFDYHRPQSLAEAVELLGRHEDTKLLAGGHSLLPMMKLRLATPTVLVDLGGLEELRFIRRQDDELIIGALTTHAEVAASEQVQGSHPGLAEAAASIGDVQVRD
ncbi:MAG: FAD binding domain-containing protein, partial [Acidobacteriota bacterium]